MDGVLAVLQYSVFLCCADEEIQVQRGEADCPSSQEKKCKSLTQARPH